MAEVIVDEAATDDYQRSAWRFEEQHPGRGRAFAHAVRVQLTQLGLHPEIGPRLLPHGCRRLLIQEFKHGIYYEVDAEVVNVRAILDLRRNPREIARLLTDRFPSP